MTYPTVSISLNKDRLTKLSEMLSRLREADETVSRSEVVSRAIDCLYPVVCPSKTTEAPQSGQVAA